MEGETGGSTVKCVGKEAPESDNGERCSTQVEDEMEFEEGSIAHRSTRDDADSDDDDDEASLGPTSSPPLPIHRIFINATPYKTYRALLHYLATNDITFAALSSSFPKSSSAAPTSGIQLEASHDSPLPVFPKSIYALAHQLEIASLAERALANFASQLTETNALRELFSDAASDVLS